MYIHIAQVCSGGIHVKMNDRSCAVTPAGRDLRPISLYLD